MYHFKREGERKYWTTINTPNEFTAYCKGLQEGAERYGNKCEFILDGVREEHMYFTIKIIRGY